jgi:hypothetical protein
VGGRRLECPLEVLAGAREVASAALELAEDGVPEVIAQEQPGGLIA